jgi:uncharacterized OB-fold protein
MSESEQQAAPAWPGLWGRDAEGAYLVAGRCERCGGQALGMREFCPHCHARGTLREARLGRTGRLYSATVIHQGPSNFKAPYRVGYVDIEGGIRIFAHVAHDGDAPRIGDIVVLDVQARSTDPEGRPLTVPVYAGQRGGKNT